MFEPGAAQVDGGRGAALNLAAQNGVAQNLGQAAEWYRKSAEQGLSIPQYNLGFMYREGFGVEQNYETAIEWMTKAAQQGLANAQYDLGLMHEFGDGTPQDDAKAVYCLTKAAEQGMPEAQNHLGVRHLEGRGLPKDAALAVQWMRRAAEVLYGQLEDLRDDQQSLFWYKKAAAQGRVDAQANLALMYIKGQGVLQDYSIATEYLSQAAAHGHPGAQHNLKRLV